MYHTRIQVVAHVLTQILITYMFTCMRPSPFRVPLAVLRSELGLGQKDFGKLVERGRPTIQAIELGKLRLTEDLAAKISAQTGISARWLLEGTPDTPMITPDGKPYTKEIFEALQAHPKARGLTLEIQDQRSSRTHGPTDEMQDPKELEMLYMRGAYVCTDWFPIYSAAAKSGKREIAEHLTLKFLDQMRERFGFDMDAARKIDGEVRFKSKKISFSIPRHTKPPA
jgi:DNA-binding XRE family transcriptional regulator